MTSITRSELATLRKEAGKYIRSLRKERGMSQLALSHALGYEYYGFISQIENGVSSIPDDKILDWADALNVDPFDFAKQLLRCYKPSYYSALFASAKEQHLRHDVGLSFVARH